MMTNSFRQEILQGTHDLLNDTLKMALYRPAATLGVATTVYTSSNEASGGAYVAGGATLANVAIALVGAEVQVSCDEIVWVTVSGTVRYALLYNASKSMKSIAVYDLSSDRTPGTQPFVLKPEPFLLASR